jgi:DNA primase
LCPFHADGRPSFTVCDDKGFFHCFGCDAHGDVIEFVSRYDNLDFGDAVRRLAGELAAGLPVADHPHDQTE